MLTRQKKLKPKPSGYWVQDIQPQSADELKAAIRGLAKQYGGKVRAEGVHG